jgi:4-amino-4-deoxy-L-arabinose transferase-like glycosyltransferase
MRQRLSSKKILLLFVFTLYYLLLGYKLMRLGLHGDGVEYAVVARNMADGVGTFWRPYLDDYLHPVFHEHPPFVFWFQSLFFKIFGDGPYLESFYGFFMGLLILAGIGVFWQQIRRDFQFPEVGSWWPMLLLVPLPEFTYTLQANRIVNTWALLALLAAYFAYLSVVKTRHAILFSILAGGTIYIGFIAKGPVAFFSLAVPILACWTLKAGFTRALIATLLSLATFVMILLATFYFSPDSITFWKGFWQDQVIASLTSKRDSGRPHWHLLERWISEMIVPFLIAFVLTLAFRVTTRKIRFNRPAMFLLLVALAGSLPFLVSSRQHGRYIFHAYPLFVLCLAFVTENVAIQIESVLNRKKTMRFSAMVIAGIFFLAALTSMIYRKDHVANRKPFYNDIYLQNIRLPERITVSACPKMMIYRDWLFADMQRFYRNSLTPKKGREYLLVDKNSKCRVPKGYKRINREPTLKYHLYRRFKP